MNIYLRDSRGSVIGWTKPFSDRIYIYNYRGEMMGWFDVPKNVTFNRKGERTGTGNQVVRLLHAP